ncbi:MAG: Fe-S metabolism protein SufE [Bdellovibrionales bacterium RBG_16_40_8]|nr:MAG: Fe-S metabolism protein SufE [Bdellovibrionales bacterium RBG_16_40_8]
MNNVQDLVIAEFSALTSWEERYKKIIAVGKSMPPLAIELKTDDRKVKGCQSQVWLDARLDENKKVQYRAESDALIVQGLIAILLKIYSNHTPKEILEIEPYFVKELGFSENLSPSRANGLYAMVKQIKYYALAFHSVV